MLLFDFIYHPKHFMQALRNSTFVWAPSAGTTELCTNFFNAQTAYSQHFFSFTRPPRIQIDRKVGGCPRILFCPSVRYTAFSLFLVPGMVLKKQTAVHSVLVAMAWVGLVGSCAGVRVRAA